MDGPGDKANELNHIGPVIYFHVFGREFVVLNTLKAAFDLFEKRSGVYSTKPRLVHYFLFYPFEVVFVSLTLLLQVMAGELVARAQTSILFLSYGARLKECRRLVHSWVNKHAVSASWPAQEAGSYKLLGALLDDPEGFSEHIRT